MCVDSWAGVTYLRYTVLTSPKKGLLAIHCCYPALSFLVMLFSRNVFHVISALQSITGIEPRPHWWKASVLTTALPPVRRLCSPETVATNKKDELGIWVFKLGNIILAEVGERFHSITAC